MTAAEISVCAARVIHADASTLLFRGQTRLNNIVYRDCILDGASLVFRRRELELIAVIVVSSISSLSSINGGRGFDTGDGPLVRARKGLRCAR